VEAVAAGAALRRLPRGGGFAHSFLHRMGMSGGFPHSCGVAAARSRGAFRRFRTGARPFGRRPFVAHVRSSARPFFAGRRLVGTLLMPILSCWAGVPTGVWA